MAFASEPAIPAQFFTIEVEFAARTLSKPMQDGETRLPFEPADPPQSVRLTLPIFEVRSDTAKPTAAKGYDLRFRFEPNELGRVDFRETTLPVSDGQLVMERHERSLRFRKVEAGEEEE